MLEDIHLEITNNCQAGCPMCGRNKNGGLENPLLRLSRWTLEEFKIILTPNVLNQVKGIYFCGNMGDPILNNDLIEMCQYVKDVNPKLNVRIHTNGSLRNTEWWKSLFLSLPENHNIIFALDGLEDTHRLYRVGTDFNKIIENAKTFISMGGIAEWAYIRFKHNEHQLEDAKVLSNLIGFKKFTTKNSSRFLLEPKFKVLDKTGKVTHILEPASDLPLKFIDKEIIDSYKTIMKTIEIDCYAFHKKEIFIDVFKNVFPCCWIEQLPYTYIDQNDATNIRIEMVNQYNSLIKDFGGIEKLNAVNNKIEKIIDSLEYQTLWDVYWNEKKLITCARTCGKTDRFSKPHDQFEQSPY
jgi:hypothetical protein